MDHDARRDNVAAPAHCAPGGSRLSARPAPYACHLGGVRLERPPTPRRRSSVVEQRFRKPQVAGSYPAVGSKRQRFPAQLCQPDPRANRFCDGAHRRAHPGFLAAHAEGDGRVRPWSEWWTTLRGWRCVTAMFRASRTTSVLRFVDIAQPTMRRLHASRTLIVGRGSSHAMVVVVGSAQVGNRFEVDRAVPGLNNEGKHTVWVAG